MKIKCNICGQEFDKLKSMTNHRRWHKLSQFKIFQDNFTTKMTGRKHSEETKRKIGAGNKNPSIESRKRYAISKYCEKNPMWKGDNVGLGALHGWVASRKPKPELCEKCKERQPYDLANISGEYKRDINDFEWLCRSCHMHKDGRINNLKQFGDKNS